MYTILYDNKRPGFDGLLKTQPEIVYWGVVKMNEIIKAMLERRSVRKYKAEKPEESIINEIINCGLYAASGKNTQGVKIIAVTNKEKRDEIAEMNRMIGGWDEGFDPFYGAPVMLIVIADKSRPTYLYDGSLVMGNLMLAAHSLGLGSCWIHRAKQEFESEQGKKLLSELGIEGDWEGIGHCALGYADSETAAAPDRKPDRVYHIK